MYLTFYQKKEKEKVFDINPKTASKKYFRYLGKKKKEEDTFM